MKLRAGEPDAGRMSLGALQTLFLRAGGGVLELGLNLVVARSCGASNAGLFHSAVTAATVASVISRLGLENSVLRLAAARAAQGDAAAVLGVVRSGLRISLAAAALVTLVLWIAAAGAARMSSGHEVVAPLVQFAAWGVLPLSFACIVGEALKAVGRFAAAQLVSAIVLPGVAAVVALLLAPRFGVAGAVGGWLAGAFAAALAGMCCWRIAAGGAVAGTPVPKGELLAGSLALLWIRIARLGTGWMATAALLVGSSAADVGIYNVALRTSLALGLLLMAVNSVAAPGFAARVGVDDREGLERIARRATRLALLAGAPVALLLLLLPGEVMGLFGPVFGTQGAVVLQVLVLGQCVNLFTGPVAYLLTMTGNEGALQHCMSIAVLAGGACLLLLHHEGALGAAIATCVAMVLQNAGATWCVWRRLGFLPMPFGATRVVSA